MLMKKYSLTTKANLRHTSPSSKRLLLTLATAVLLLVFFYVIPKAFTSISAIAVEPFLQIGYWVENSGGAIPSYLRGVQVLREERDELEEKLLEYQSASTTIAYLESENKELQALLGKDPKDKIFASVLQKPPAVAFDLLVVNKGTKEGIVKNSGVYGPGGQAIGFVTEVYANTAVVSLLSTPGLVSTVYVYGPDIYTTAIGQGGGVIEVHVPQGVALEVGNAVVVPGLEAQVYGTVVAVEADPTKPELYGAVTTAVNYQEIKSVLIDELALPELTFEETREIVAEVYQTEVLEQPIPEAILTSVPVATSTATTTEDTANETEL